MVLLVELKLPFAADPQEHLVPIDRERLEPKLPDGLRIDRPEEFLVERVVEVSD